MGIGFSLTGLFLIVTGAQNTYAQAGAQIEKDFTGPANFGYWLVALVLVGALGYIKSLKTFSTYFMALVLLSLFLSKGKGFFSQFSTAVEGAANAPAGVQAPTVAAPAPSSGTSAATSLGNTNAPGSPATSFSNWLTGTLNLPSWLPLN